jgi:hypothetical protein
LRGRAVFLRGRAVLWGLLIHLLLQWLLIHRLRCRLLVHLLLRRRLLRCGSRIGVPSLYTSQLGCQLRSPVPRNAYRHHTLACGIGSQRHIGLQSNTAASGNTQPDHGALVESVLLRNLPILSLQGSLLELLLQPGTPHFHVEDVCMHHVKRQRAPIHKLVRAGIGFSSRHEHSRHCSKCQCGRNHDNYAQWPRVAASCGHLWCSLHVLPNTSLSVDGQPDASTQVRLQECQFQRLRQTAHATCNLRKKTGCCWAGHGISLCARL